MPTPQGGRRSKGERRAIAVRVPADYWPVLDALRRDLGYDSLSDFCNALLAQAAGLPVPEYVLDAMQEPNPNQPAILPRRLRRAS